MVETLIADARLNEQIVVRDEGAVRHVILNRPEVRNALNRQMRRDFATILAAADAEPAIGAVVLSGAGGTFSAGLDLKDRPPAAAPIEPNPGAALRSLDKPLIAAVDGACVTGALEIALSCDFAIATPRARFADTHCGVGFFPRWGGGHLLVSRVGAARARQMMLTGEFVNANKALAWGIVNEIVPEGRLLERATELAEAMVLQNEANPVSFALHREMIETMDTDQSFIEIERDCLARFDLLRKQ